MDLVNVRTFLAAAATGSFSEAASRVSASPSAVTERIKQLEHELRVRLFDRDKRGCRLTPSGRRFLVPAQQMLRAWQHGAEQAALPAQFSQALHVGGQHALWPTILIPWLMEMRAANPAISFRATAAAPAQLNRALEDADMDIAFHYDPIIRRGILIEELASDRLVLVTATPSTPWQSNFARIDWGESATAELRARVGDFPAAGLELDLGILSLDWLVQTGSSGFVPERLAVPYLQSGKLEKVDDMPTVEFAPFVCWRASMDQGLVREMIEIAKRWTGGLML